MRHFLIYLLDAQTYFNETCHSHLQTGPHETDDIVKVVGSKVKTTDSILSKIHFSGQGIVIRRPLAKVFCSSLSVELW